MEKYIDVDEVVANASTFIEEMSDELALMMRQWVWMAMRDIGPNYGDVTTAEIEIIGSSAQKPLNMIGNFIDLAVYTAEGHEINYNYNFDGGRVHDSKLIKSVIDIYEDANYVHFSDFALIPDYMIVKYYTMPLDSCNLPKVPESHLNAVVAFIKFCYYYRQGNRSDMIVISRNHWLDERAKVRGRNKSVAGIRAKQIEKEWMTHIPKVNRRRF